MNLKMIFIIALLICLFFNISMVTANDFNSSDSLQNDNSFEVENNLTQSNLTSEVDNPIVKSTPSITISSNNLKSKDILEVFLKNSSGSPISFKNIKININSKTYSIKTNSKGIANFKINLPAKSYKLSIISEDDDKYNNITKTFNIKVYKIKTKITQSSNFVVRGNYLHFQLTDNLGNSVPGKKIKLKFNKKTYTKKTNKYGKVKIKINLPKSKYSIKTYFKADNQFKSSSKKLKFYVINQMSLKIGNSKLITEGFLRVYLKDSSHSINKKTIKLIIGNKKFTKKTNSEGIVVFKPEVKAKHYTVKVKLGKYYSCKNIKCYDGKVKDPLKESVVFKNGVPDIDVMPKNYIMANENAKYTLTKSQYKDVLKRDSYCLFLNNKLTKYTFFKTKSHPHINHVIKREKWNVIERAINTKLVRANKHGYWPGKITVSLKGKSYTYPEVRDAQNTGYTCGPTSGSVCSQVLKNYVCEKYLAKLAGTTKRDGTKCSGIKKALEKNNFNCTYYYKASFNMALKELKKGGTALVFHAYKHYVTIIDISDNGKKVLVSNSYGSYDKIPTKWLKVSYMKKKFSPFEESLTAKLNYKLSDSTKNSVNNYYHSFGSWLKHNTHQGIGRI